jgi:hypothetical protein
MGRDIRVIFFAPRSRTGQMTRYFFDTRDDALASSDEFGIAMQSLTEAQLEAARCIAEMAKDVVPSSVARDLEVTVRDETGKQLMRATLNFKIEKNYSVL